MIKLILISICLILSGCTSIQMSMIEKRLLKNGHTTRYVEGYLHGCTSGYYAAGNPYHNLVKNHDKYTNDNLYKNGWDDAYRACMEQYKYNTMR